MSEPQPASRGTGFHGLVQLTELAGGLVLLRGAAGVQALALGALGLAVPGQRRIIGDAALRVGWMAPDELLLVLPDRPGVAALLALLHPVLAGQHHLLADISDSRVMLRLSGRRWREVLAKAAPVDLAPAVFAPGELRRSRAGQVAVAFWAESADVAVLIAPRSVAGHVLDLLRGLARPGSEVGLFD